MSGATVVVVDDDPESADLLALYLERSGCVVVAAADGEEGLEAVRRHRPAAVVCDALLPRRTGFEVCRLVKSDPDLAATRVVVLSAVYRTARYAREAADAGADRFLAKPVEPTRLLEALAPALDGHPAGSGDEFAAALATARERYREKVPGRIEEALALADRLSLGWDPEAAGELRMLLHGLAGAGATMGLARLGGLARELEGLVDLLLERGRAPDADQRRRLRRTLGVLRQAHS